MEEFENKDTMERLKIKRQLMLDTSEIFEFFSKRIAVYKVCGRYGRKYLNNALKEVYKDYKKGVKQINEKIPVYIELPTYKKEGENMYSKNFDLKGNSTKEITVTPPVVRNETDVMIKNDDVDILPSEETD